MSILSNYSDEEFARIVADSTNYTNCLLNLGYNAKSGSILALLKQRIKELNLDISHFQISTPTERTVDNIFIENSTADQKTLRKWYLQGEYTPYQCSICGQLPEWQNKPLTLILDHINGENKDDRLENLRWVCPNCNQQLDTTNGKNKKHKDHNLNYCIDCGKPITKRATRCLDCANKFRTSKTVENISRDELKKLIRTTPFTTIATQYNVTDNAVRKWCDKYNLPRKVSDIKQISDDDWEKI